MRSGLDCRVAALAGVDPTGCRRTPPPSCGAEALDAVVEAALGSADAEDSGGEVGGDVGPEARRCQVAIARVAGHLTEYRLRERRAARRQTRGARIARVIRRRCHGVEIESVGGVPLPRVGGACAPLANRVGQRIDGVALERCLRGAFEGIVDAVAPRAMQPNIVLVLTDDQRWDTMGYMPSTFTQLAGRGLVFRNAFATTPSCSPSRASMYSGRLARNHGVVGNGFEPEFDPSNTIATVLSDAGYVNGFFGKYLNRAGDLDLEPPPGWDEWNVFLRPSGGSYFGSQLNTNGVIQVLAPGEYSTDVMSARTVQFLRENASRPFFAVYAPYAPHDPSEPAPRHVGLFAGLPLHRPPNWHEADVSLKPTWVQFFARIVNEKRAARRDQQRTQELETLLAVDEGIAAISRQLERSGLTESTVVVFVSDHGIHWGEHWTGTKFTAYEESIRIPFVMRYPARIPLPRSVDALVANIDLAPTLADLAGASPLPGVDGASLTPFLDGSNPEAWRDEVPIESGGGLITRPSRALRTDRWKYIEVVSKGGVRQELYDLDADPYELQNLAFDPAHEDTRSDLAARLGSVLP
ncbi:MAG: sulfatase [Candidatus Binatia bacterium]|nr:sulfatase [Candidatus Binatia bacterium]